MPDEPPKRENEVHDHGFRRYPLAGMAHLGYFEDVELFVHIYDNAIQPGNNAPVQDVGWVRRFSPVFPFVVVAAVHVAAIVLLHRSLSADKMAETFALLKSRALPGIGGAVEWLRSWPGVIACGLLLLGSTVWSRAGVIAGFRSAQGIDAGTREVPRLKWLKFARPEFACLRRVFCPQWSTASHHEPRSLHPQAVGARHSRTPRRRGS